MKTLQTGRSKTDPAAGDAPPAVGDDVLVTTFNAIRDELVSTLVYLLHGRDAAEDAAQETFIKCWRARGTLTEVHNIRAWIFRVGLNAAKDMQRSAWNRKSRPITGDEAMIMGRETVPADRMEHAEEVETLRRAILDLRDEEKEVFLLRQNGELTYEQIAEIRSMPVGTVKTQMRAALHKLKARLA